MFQSLSQQIATENHSREQPPGATKIIISRIVIFINTKIKPWKLIHGLLSYQHTLIILLFTLRLNRFAVDILTFICSAQYSSVYSLHLSRNNLSSSGVKLHSIKNLSISFFVNTYNFMSMPLINAINADSVQDNL